MGRLGGISGRLVQGLLGEVLGETAGAFGETGGGYEETGGNRIVFGLTLGCLASTSRRFGVD